MTSHERRKQVRLMPKELTYIALRPEFSKLGRVLNITSSGLCFQYMTEGNMPDNGLPLNLDIFIADDRYYLPCVSCHLIYDIETNDSTAFHAGMRHRICGVRFEKFKKEQSDQLKYFLKDHTATL